jgi:hypothetical protein
MMGRSELSDGSFVSHPLLYAMTLIFQSRDHILQVREMYYENIQHGFGKVLISSMQSTTVWLELSSQDRRLHIPALRKMKRKVSRGRDKTRSGRISQISFRHYFPTLGLELRGRYCYDIEPFFLNLVYC